MSDKNMNQDNNTKRISLDLVALLRLIRQDKKKMTIYLAVAAVLSIVVAFSIPRRYTAYVMLAPETANNSIMSSVSSIASMVGLYNDGNPMGDAIYPEIYPELMGSKDFLVKMFDIKVKSIDGEINTTYYDYLDKHQKSPWWSYPLEAASRLIENMKSEKAQPSSGKVDPFRLTKKQFGIANKISKLVTCSVDKKTNVISISTEAQDPLICATLADSTKSLLQEFITKYRTTKARNDLQFMEKLFAEARDSYVKARQKYASFSDSNTEVILESVRSKQADLENEMQLQYNIYTQVAQQLQMARAKVQERTPAFTVIQTATVPFKHSNTQKIVYLVVFLFLGFAVRLCCIIRKNFKQVLVFS